VTRYNFDTKKSRSLKIENEIFKVEQSAVIILILYRYITSKLYKVPDDIQWQLIATY